MNKVGEFWAALGRPARVGFVVGCIAIAATAVTGVYWVTRTSYGVLFSGLSNRDSAAIVAALEKDKIGYRLDGDGSTILVPDEQVHKVRLKLAGAELPLQGGVGFELFNNNEVGMTDFAQKVNYQRALQGELTRTIGALDEVQATRVHLALPEQGLFRRAGAAARAKASVTLTLKPGRHLSREQTRGIQRLVAASVPDVRPEDVTVLDQRGLALTSEGGGTEGAPTGASGFDGKREVEEYLGRKLRDVLDETFGAGLSIARIDVVLNQDQTRVTTESVLPANSSQGHPAGVVVRQMETGTPRDPSGALSPEPPSGGRTRDVHYQVGRRVEQIVSVPGGISRINVAVVVKRPLDQRQTERLKEIVAASVGFNRMRGDTMAIHSIDQILGAGESGAQTGASSSGDAHAVDAQDDALLLPKLRPPAKPAGQDFDATMRTAGTATVVLLIAVMLAFAWMLRKRSKQPPPSPAVGNREALLRDVQGWLRERADGAAKRT
ncbi:flagellar basal-body MS-ring/collar protein FliF [Aquabacterium humicola]|uniref:flagellar basal-body MS-ring/collar protein FliF n=1 Tax=Aquabacterium humicola TaxID=3237377 RepID=UPI002543714D|nr:flagellar basal-body MS-ring/collar protein FliF [Rubrivivax pictus]